MASYADLFKQNTQQQQQNTQQQHAHHHHAQYHNHHSYDHQYGNNYHHPQAHPQQWPSLHAEAHPQQWPSLGQQPQQHHNNQGNSYQHSPPGSPEQSSSQLHATSGAWSPSHTSDFKWSGENVEHTTLDLQASAEAWGPSEDMQDSDTESDVASRTSSHSDQGNNWHSATRKHSWSSTDSNSSVGSIEIVPSQHNENDGFNYGKMPSGCVAVTSSGQWVEFWQGVHVDEHMATVPGKQQPAQNWQQPQNKYGSATC